MATHVNANVVAEDKARVGAAAAAATTVWVSNNYFGAAVTSVKQSTSASENMYFLNVSLAHTANSVLFVVTFKNGSPLTSQEQSFSFPGGYGGGITTPFGVPDWGGNPILGPAVLTVLANGAPVGSYNFNVVV